MEHIKSVKYAGNHRTNLMRFDSINEFEKRYFRQKHKSYQNATKESGHRSKWQGADWETFARELKNGSLSYAAKADRYLDHFTNVALETMGIDAEYNYEAGFLDAGMYNAGDPMCLYGPTLTESPRAPVRVYLDTWISSTIKPQTILNRGVALLALVRAVSIHRPVLLEIVGGWRNSPTSTNGIVTCTAPTTPMDLARASWMVAAPQFVRVGMMSMFYDCVETDKQCGMPMLSGPPLWQETQLGNFLAERDGATPDETVFLPLMYDNGIWNDQASCLKWVKKQASRFMPTLEEV